MTGAIAPIMKFSSLLAASFLAVVTLAACSGSTTGVGTGDGGVTSGDGAVTTSDGGATSTSGYCAQDDARAAKCGDAPDGSCNARAVCYETKLRPGVASGLEACLVGRACDAGDDHCFADAAAPYASAPVPARYMSACTAKKQACDSAGGGSFSDDYCASTVALFPDAVVTKLETCLDDSCGEVRDCFEAAVSAIGCGN
ncbi:MAG: hypothetical protein JWP97_3478 [Labilithrix sp.]|nr:hypothetical protein [Labilithrix sp.]